MGAGMLVTVLGTLISSHQLGTCCLLACSFEGRAETAPGEEDARKKVSASDGSPFEAICPLPGEVAAAVLGWNPGSSPAVPSFGLQVRPAAPSGVVVAGSWVLAGHAGVPAHRWPAPASRSGCL